MCTSFEVSLYVLFLFLSEGHSTDLVTTPPMSVNVSLNDEVIMTCFSDVDGVALSWDILGAFTPNTTVLLNGILITATFTATIDRNITEVRCIATLLGPPLVQQESDPALILIQGPPSAPADLSQNPIDPCSTKLTWLRPFTLDGVPLSYDLSITSVDTGEIVVFASITAEEYVFSPVDLSATYNVQLLAWNAAGTSNEVSLEVVFTEDVVAIFSGISRDKITWMLNFTLLSSCMNEVLASATINLYPNNEEQNYYPFLDIEGYILQHVGSRLNVSFAVQILEDITYNSTIQLFYERGQELRSSPPLPISTVDAQIVVSNHSNGSACFSLQKIVGSVLYGLVVQFDDTSSSNNIIKLVVANTSNMCIDDLDPGVYSISVGELNVPLVPIPAGQEITIQEHNTLTENTPSPSPSTPMTNITCQDCDGYIIGLAISGGILLVIVIVIVIVGFVIYYIWKHYHCYIRKYCRQDCIQKFCVCSNKNQGRCVSSGCVNPTKEDADYECKTPVEETHR